MLTWNLPAPRLAKQPTPGPLGRTLDFDGDFTVLPDGSVKTVEGRDALRQDLQTRLVTSPGEHALRPEFGAGLRAAVKSAASRDAMERLRARTLTQVRSDSRVTDVPAVSVERLEPNGLRIKLTLNVLGEVVTLRPIEVT